MNKLGIFWAYLTAPLAKVAALRVHFALPEAFWKPTHQKPFKWRHKR